MRAEGSRQNRGEPCRLLPVDISGRGSVVVMTGGVRTINPGSLFDHIEVDLQNALLAKKEFGERHQCELRAFAEDRATGSEEGVSRRATGETPH